MALQYSQFIVSDFSGGVTDRYINANQNSYRYGDNFLITEYDTLELRSGYRAIYQQQDIRYIMGIFQLNEELFIFRDENLFLFDDALGTVTQVVKKNIAEPFLKYTGNNSFTQGVEWRNQLHVLNTGQELPVAYNKPMRVWRNDLNILESVEMGIPKFDGSSMTFTPTIGVDVVNRSYLYALHYSYTYKVGGVTFKNVSTVFQSEVVSMTNAKGIGDGTTVDIDVFPFISGTGNQLDVSNIKVELYRTIDGALALHKVTEFTNGFSGPYTDNNKDEDIISNELIYTDGGFTEHYPVPKSKTTTVVNDVAWYGGVVEELDSGDELRPYRLQQAIPSVPSAINPTAYKDLDDDIVGVSHFKGIPMVFTKSFIYRIDGVVDALGAGVIRARALSSEAGCLSNSSIVRTDSGIFWAGLDGFYVSDGFKISRITETRLTKRFSEYADTEDKRKRVIATYDKEHERVKWAMSSDGVLNDYYWVLDLRTGSFTNEYGKDMNATSLFYNENRILRGDDFGYIYSHSDGETSDYLRDLNANIEDWKKEHIPYRFESVAYNFGNPHNKYWVQQSTFSIKASSNSSITPFSINDDGRSDKKMKTINPSGFITWGDENFVWGNPDTVWRPSETAVYQRHFPRGGMRCRRKQIRLIPERVILYRSDVFDTGTVAYETPALPNPTRFTVTLDSGKWPIEITGEQIHFEEDGYVKTYNIESRSDTTLVITGGGLTIGPAKKWYIKGYRKDQQFEIKAFSMTFAPLTNVGNKFDKTQSGENA